MGQTNMNQVHIRRATPQDIPGAARIYDMIHAEEEAGRLSTGWIRNIYPVRQTAAEAQNRGDLFVAELDSRILGSAIINQEQHPSYANGSWKIKAAPSAVMVLHTLAIDPEMAGTGLGRRFVEFYSAHAQARGCFCLRMDTNIKNLKARAIYARYGFSEAGIVHINFNGIDGVDLLLLERKA